MATRRRERDSDNVIEAETSCSWQGGGETAIKRHSEFARSVRGHEAERQRAREQGAPRGREGGREAKRQRGRMTNDLAERHKTHSDG